MMAKQMYLFTVQQLIAPMMIYGLGQTVKYKVTEGKKGLVGQDVEILLTALERRWLRQGKNLIPRENSIPNLDGC